jgi:hypothetical protein
MRLLFSGSLTDDGNQAAKDVDDQKTEPSASGLQLPPQFASFPVRRFPLAS